MFFNLPPLLGQLGIMLLYGCYSYFTMAEFACVEMLLEVERCLYLANTIQLPRAFQHKQILELITGT